MNELLVIVDMVKDFVNEWPLADNKISKITPKIIEQIKYFLSNSLPIISFRDCHSSDDEFKIYPPHCIKGTSESELVNELLNAEADSTAVALCDYNRPNVTITLPKVNAYYVAQLLYMLEVQTAIAGELYNINTFNQPGVEQAKNYTYALMGRAGYEDSAKILREKMGV